MRFPSISRVVDDAEIRATLTKVPEEQVDLETSKGFWSAFRRSASTILSNYMYQQGILGRYGDSGEFGDP